MPTLPLFNKLNYKEQQPVAILGAPESFEAEIKSLLPHTRVDRAWAEGEVYDFALIFVKDAAEITQAAAHLKGRLTDDPVLWLAYPKKSSKQYQTDISRDQGWAPLGQLSYEPVRQVAIDVDWSALRFRPTDRIKNMTRRQNMTLSDQGKKRTEGQ
jgi:hypothetical protein